MFARAFESSERCFSRLDTESWRDHKDNQTGADLCACNEIKTAAKLYSIRPDVLYGESEDVENSASDDSRQEGIDAESGSSSKELNGQVVNR